MTCANALVVHTMTTRERAVVSYSETLLARYRHLGNNAPSRLVLRFDDVCERKYSYYSDAGRYIRS